MSSRKITLFYAVLIALASLAVGMVIASRLDLSPESSAQSLAVPPMNSAPLSGPIDAGTFRNIAKAQEPVVVNIQTESRRRQDMSDFFGGDDLFNRFFGGQGGQGGRGQGGQGQGQQRQPPEQVMQSAGSGFVISRDGFILTNNHVVEGATKIKVYMLGEDPLFDEGHDARIIGRDPLTDSALIELTQTTGLTLQEAKFGDSSLMQPGDWVMAIGNPFALAHTVTVGVISAIKRPFQVAEQRSQDMLQTDAAINPGNSGGPLMNVRGEVVGINTAIMSNSQSSGNMGIGFAVPINVVRDLLPQLRTGKIVRGRIGVSVRPVPAGDVKVLRLTEPRGALVVTVTADGPAAKAGLEPGDVIVEYNGKVVKDRDDLIAVVMATKPGTTVPIRIVRDKQQKSLNVTVEELDLAAESGQTAGGGQGGGTETEAGTGFGMTLGNITPNIARQLRLPQGVSGVLITDVDQAGPADKATVRQYDVLLEVNRQPVNNVTDARRLLDAVKSGDKASLLIWREGQRQFLIIRKD
jgi:serine protease Do